jgi:hypothetical protein
VIAVTPIPSGFSVDTRYWDETLGAPQLLSFDVMPDSIAS